MGNKKNKKRKRESSSVALSPRERRAKRPRRGDDDTPQVIEYLDLLPPEVLQTHLWPIFPCRPDSWRDLASISQTCRLYYSHVSSRLAIFPPLNYLKNDILARTLRQVYECTPIRELLKWEGDLKDSLLHVGYALPITEAGWVVFKFDIIFATVSIYVLGKDGYLDMHYRDTTTEVKSSNYSWVHNDHSHGTWSIVKTSIRRTDFYRTINAVDANNSHYREIMRVIQGDIRDATSDRDDWSSVFAT